MKPEERIFTEGKHLAFRPYYNYIVNLYELDDEFYEVWYFRPTNVIEGINKLEDKKTLNTITLTTIK